MCCRIITLAKQLIACPSISPNDAGCQELLIDHLKKIGFFITKLNISDTYNFWATHGTSGKTLAFAGHTDVVPPGNTDAWITPPFEPIIRNGILFGRGAVDMKGALAAIIIALENFITRHPYHKGRLAVLITSDEESNGINGTNKIIEYLINSDERLDYCVIGEPSSTKIIGDVIKNGRRGSMNIHLTIYGIQGHVAYLDPSDNLIHSMIPILNQLINTTWDQGNSFFPATSMQITQIYSGYESNNVTPDHLDVKLNFRFSPELTSKIIKNRIIKILDDSQLKYNIKCEVSGEPFLTTSGKLIDAAIDAVMFFNKKIPQLLTTGGTSDGRFIIRMGAEIIELGAVNTTIHQTNESVRISDLHTLSCMYQRIIENIML